MRLFKFFIFIALIILFISEQLKSAIPFEENSLKIRKLPEHIRLENYGFTLDQETPAFLDKKCTLKKRQGSFVIIEQYVLEDRTLDLLLNEIRINHNYLLSFSENIDLKYLNLHIPEDFIRSDNDFICYSRLRGIDKNGYLVFQKVYFVKLKNNANYQEIDKNLTLFMKSIKNISYPPFNSFFGQSKL